MRTNKNPHLTEEQVTDLRHRDAKRKNIPPAGIAAKGNLVKESKVKYSYNPHVPPALRFDPAGRADRVNQLLAKLASAKSLSDDEISELQALAKADPWLEWSGKREQPECVVDPVALQVHERISTQAILRVAARDDVPRTLFADPEQEYRDAVQFYRHDVDWANRLILGDSLAVMASLARREGLAGKVQMIYMDPPYGIKYASNFQSEVGKRDVKDRDQDLTREAEMVKAYRDTWTLGVHSYLSYLRDRLVLCKELLADTGSIFVQISDENLHRVRTLLDEVFGAENAVTVISFATTGGFATKFLSRAGDYLLWYAKDKERTRYRQLYRLKVEGALQGDDYRFFQTEDGEIRTAEDSNRGAVDLMRLDNTVSQGAASSPQSLDVCGRDYSPNERTHWKAQYPSGMYRLVRSGRLFARDGSLAYKRFVSDYPAFEQTNLWPDTSIAGTSAGKAYIVSTNPKVIERCMLMTSSPGDLVLDPTCGGGTTAVVAEELGRRCITVDTSRVALSIARQRLLTSRYDSYRMRPLSGTDLEHNPNGTWLTDPAGEVPGPCIFDCKTISHITLKSIAQNQALV